MTSARTRSRIRGLALVGAAWALALIGPADAAAQGAVLTPDEAVSAALETDPGLAATAARGDAALEDVAGARAGRLPSLSLDGSATRFEEPMVVAPLHSFDPSSPPRFDETLVQGAARIRYTAFDGGVTGARVRAARAHATAAEAVERGHRMELIERVSGSYLSVLAARAQAEAATLRVQALEAERDRAQRRVQVGAAAEVESLRATAALEEARADEATARARRTLAERTLSRAMGLAAEALGGRPVADVDLRAPDSVLGSVGAPADHPDLIRAAEGERAAEARVAEQRAGRLPRLDLSAALLDFGTASGGHVNEWQAGVAISWPVFTGGGRSAAVRRAELDLVAAREDRATAERGLAALADAAYAAVEEADARALALAASVAQWTEVARIERLALDTGAGVQSDLLAAEAALFRARAGLAQARYDRLYARVRLARSQGLLDRDWLRRSLEVVP